ncbi:MAG: hypothetical protein IJA34_16060, partial [Lachnospiraceae bacterium]|nr:hypothetical protein [Lachnospiraceae bacterium]
NDNKLVKATITRTVFVSIELIALIVISIITLSNDGTSAWGYWGNVVIVFGTLSPVIVYVIASAIFNVFNMSVVFKKRHTIESIKKCYKLSKIYLIWGIVTGGIYGFLLVPIFLLENIFLLCEYKKEIELVKQCN